ncbi:MAG: hypothetical protein NTY59_13885 [Alphaproteobacteria bacterium]|nr:hypothetical protein [Alphaproteobacteria bacterium]
MSFTGEKDFIGRASVLARQEKGEPSALVYLEVDAADQDCLGGEVIVVDGRKSGVHHVRRFRPYH